MALSINKDAVFVSLLLTYLTGVYVASTCYLVLVHICKSAVIISSPVEFCSQRGLARNETCKVMCMLLNSGYV
jgi:hypothetical protein